MPQAQLTLTVPEEIWVGDLSRMHPEARIRVLAAFADDDSGVALAEVGAPDLPDVLARMEDYDAVTDLELLGEYDGGALVQFETTTPLLLVAVRDSGVPLEMPFEVVEGRAEWTVTAPRDRLSELGERLEALGVPYTVEAVHRGVEPDRVLTERQRDLLRTAVEAGYYDTPRTCSLTDLADRLDIAKSTCSERLHRAESAVVKQFLDDVRREWRRPE